MTWLWSATIFVNALLLFWLEPMAAKMLLPFLGGTAAVWNTCLMFFQVTLVAGYAYAHLLNSRLGVKAAAAVHMTLMIGATATLPIVLNAQPPAGSPTIWLIGRLAVMIGLPRGVGRIPAVDRADSGLGDAKSRLERSLYGVGLLPLRVSRCDGFQAKTVSTG